MHGRIETAVTSLRMSLFSRSRIQSVPADITDDLPMRRPAAETAEIKPPQPRATVKPRSKSVDLRQCA
jgi:hypothetical protein